MAADIPPLLPNADESRAQTRAIRSQYETLKAELDRLPYIKSPGAAIIQYRRVLISLVDLCYLAECAAEALGLPFEEAAEATRRAHTTGGTVDLTSLLPDIINHEEVPDHG